MNLRTFIIIIVTLFPLTAWSCKCVELPIIDRYLLSDVVLFGYISKPSEVASLLSYSEGKSDRPPLVTFQTIDALKGGQSGESFDLSVMYGTTCEANIKLGVKLIIFASVTKKGYYEVSKCSIFLAQQYKTESGEVVGPSKKETESTLTQLRDIKKTM